MRVSESLVQGIKISFQTYLKILCLDGLTSIKIDYKRKEISLQVSEDDYSILGDTTYHLLGEKIIRNFKESVLASPLCHYSICLFYNKKKEGTIFVVDSYFITSDKTTPIGLS